MAYILYVLLLEVESHDSKHKIRLIKTSHCEDKRKFCKISVPCHRRLEDTRLEDTVHVMYRAPRCDGDVRMYRRLFVVCGRGCGRAGVVVWRFIREHVIEDGPRH